MGQRILTWYREKINRSEKIAFFSAVIIGFLVHAFTFTNTNIIGDSIARGYTPQDMTVSGRWFLQFACGISSYYDLPWFNGILSIFYIALTMVVIVRLFKMENPIAIVLGAGLLVSFPSVTSTFFYNFTADGYMLSMLLSALSVYFIRFEEKRISRFILGGICLCLSCGIYQAYVSFALVLTVCIFLKEILENDLKIKELFKWLGLRIAVFFLSIAAYWGIWKILSKFKEVEAIDYQGISNVGKISISGLIDSVIDTIKTLLKFVFDWDPIDFGVDGVAVLKIVALAVSGAVVLIAFVKSGLFKRKGQAALGVLSVCCLPVFICLWQFTSSSLNYHILMLQSICLIFIFALALAEKYLSVKLKNVVALVMACLTFYFAMEANISYYHLDKTYQRTYATAQAISVRVNSLIDENTKKLSFVGYRNDNVMTDENKNEFRYSYIAMARMKDHISHHTKAVDFLELYFEVPLEPLSEEESVDLLHSPEVEEMSVWPSKDSVKVVGDTIVVKLGEKSYDEIRAEKELKN